MMRLLGNLVMTRLLVPDDFGLMAMAMTLQAGLMMATDIGLNLSVIRSARGEDPLFLRTAWTIKILRHLQLAALFVGMAALLAWAASTFDFGDSVYADPLLPWVMAGLAVPLAMRGFNSINLALSERRLDMRRFVLINIAAQVASIVSMVLFALVEPSVWALVWGGIIGGAVRLVASHIFIPGPRMGLTLEREHYREIWGFGKWLMGASFLGFLGKQGDRLLLGALLTPVDFGIYAIARIWVDAGLSSISKVTDPTINAAISEVGRERPKSVLGVFRRIRLLQNAVFAAMFLVIVLGGDFLIETLYTDAYQGVGVILMLLSPMLLLRMWGPYGALLLTKGESRNYATVTLIRCVALFVMLPSAFFLGGPPWAYFTIAVNQAWGVPQQLRLAARYIKISIPREALQLSAVVALAAALTILVP